MSFTVASRRSLLRRNIAIASMLAVSLCLAPVSSSAAEKPAGFDPKVRDCIERNLRAPGPSMTRDNAVALCKRLEAMGGL